MINYNNWPYINEFLSNKLSSNKNISIFINDCPQFKNGNYVHPHNGSIIKKTENQITIFLQIESSYIIKTSMDWLLKSNEVYDFFDYILTFDEKLLLKQKSYKILPLLNYSWVKFPKYLGINPYLINHYNYKGNYEYDNKIFNVSMLCSDTNWAPGHILRHKIWNKQNEITIPKMMYKPPQTNKLKLFENNINISSKRDKTEMFNSMFHICIENNQAKDYFTEKIVDCIVSKTVPIYNGCPNISDYFDINGIIFVKDENDAINKVNNLTEADYYRMLPYLEKNLRLLKLLPSFETQINNFLLSI